MQQWLVRHRLWLWETGDVTSLKSFLDNQQHYPLPFWNFVVIQPLLFETDRFHLVNIFL